MPGEMGLSFSRYYVSRHIHGSTTLGGWNDNLAYELHITCFTDIAGSCNTATFWRPDGSTLSFTQSGQGANAQHLHGPFTEVGGGGHATLTYIPGDDPGVVDTYVLVDEDAMVYTFRPNGALTPPTGLVSIKNPAGVGWTIGQSPDGTITNVTHTSGQRMRLVTSMEGNVGVLTVTDPAGNNYVYKSLAGNSTTFDLVPLNIAEVDLPGTTPTTITYSYTGIDPNNSASIALSQVSYNGVPYELTHYDSSGRADQTSAADGTHKVSVVYSSNATGPIATLTNELGHVSVYQFDAKAELKSITGQVSARCAATFASNTYDANGNLQSATDNNGYVINYTYADNGQLQQRIEAAGTPLARTTNYQWDTTPGTDRLLSITVVGYTKTTYAYDANSRIISIATTNLSNHGIANQTLTTGYGYTLYANGMVQTTVVTHPSPNGSNTDTYHYDTLGNLTSYVDGLGHATSYSNYNLLAEPGRAIGPNGDVTDYTYEAQGRLASKTIYPAGSAATTNYQYDGFGLLSYLQTPDGATVTWNRDAYMQVHTVVRNDKDGDSTETFGRDAMGNVTSYALTRGSDVGLSWTAVYDELGRLYQKMGNHSQLTSYTYDGNGNVHTITNAAGHVVAYDHDALNRVIKITESGGATPVAPTASPILTVPGSSTTGSYVVSWTGVSGASSYTLQEQVNGGAWSSVQSNSSGSWNTSGKANGTYGYRVQACNAVGCGPFSVVSSIVVAIPPPPASAPSISVPTSSFSGSYSVSWTGVSGASTYVLQEQVNAGAWATVQNNASAAWSTSGRGTGTYGYRVQACNITGCGPWSATATIAVTLPPATAPGISVPASSNNGAYTITWSGVAGASSYLLQEQVNGGTWTTVQNNASGSWSTNGRAGGSYSYRVQACNAAGCGPFSSAPTLIVNIPLAFDGQQYFASSVVSTQTGIASAIIGFDIATGSTWEIYSISYVNTRQLRRVQASGAVPTGATSLKYTWTLVGVPSGAIDGGGSAPTSAASPIAISGNPDTEYGTASVSWGAPLRGRTYQLKIDFYNTAGVNISTSIATLTAEVSGSP